MKHGPESFSGLILMVSEDIESQVKVFWGLLWFMIDNIKIVGRPGGHLNSSSALAICFGWINE